MGKMEISKIGHGKTVVIDYSAPNIARRFGIGHLRSTIIGQALYNIYQALGYKCIGDNHLGDWGTQFGKLLYMIATEKPKELSIEKLEELYVKFHKMAEEDKTLEEKGREWFKKIEDGDPEARKLWQKCADFSVAEFNKIYDLLNVKFDFTYGESFYEDKMGAVIAEAKEKGLVKLSEEAWIIEIPNEKAPLILVKSDGGTTYATRDLATLKFRTKTWDPNLIIYEVGVEQSQYFSSLFIAAKLFGYVKPETQLIHTKHGMYRWSHGRFRTREGNTPKLEEILNESITRAKKLMNERKIALDLTGKEFDMVTKAVGVGAIKYFDLKHGVQSDIVFDWEKMFSLEGDSGPYLQYTYARAKSVLKKAEKNSAVSKISTSTNYNLTTEELAVLRYLYRFPEIVESAAKNYSPNLICTYLFELAKRFNNFYNNQQIISQNSTQSFRLALTKSTAETLKKGLTLLGIEALEKM
jgi:arginyl-tRNA synthetase